jgi:hypothetical protein
MATTLELTDGTLGVVLNDNQNFRFSRDTWTPMIAPRRRSYLGGMGVFGDVDEQMTIDVLGSTADAALYNLRVLDELLDRAERWYQGENISPVLLKYRPDGSTATVSQCAVLGRSGDDSGRELTAQLHRVGSEREIRGVKLSFRRRAQWLTSATAVSSSATAAATIATLTFASAGEPYSPVTLLLSDWNSVFTGSFTGVIAFANDIDNLKIMEGEATTRGTDDGTAVPTIVADVAGNARGGNVRRIANTTNTGVASRIQLYFTGVGASWGPEMPGRFLVVMMCRTNGTSSWGLRVGAQQTGVIQYSQWKEVPGSSTPTPISFTVTAPLAGVGGGLIFEAFKNDTTANTLDIDCALVLAIDDPHSGLVQVQPFVVGSGGNHAITIDHSLLTRPRPVALVNAAIPASTVPYSMRGDVPLVHQGTSLFMVVFTPGGAQWNNSTLGSLTYTATRTQAYRTPV